MSTAPACPKCSSQYTYADGNNWVCPECAHEWSMHMVATTSSAAETETADNQVRDANGQILNDGDTVTVIKDLKVKGSSSVVKVGTKVKNIRLSDAGDGHDIACKIEGFGAMNLKSEYVKKV